MLTFDRRNNSSTPVQQFGSGVARILGSKRSSSTLDKDVGKARVEVEKQDATTREHEDKSTLRIRTLSEKGTSSTSFLSGLWSPKSPKRSEQKKRKKELEKQLIRDIAEGARFRANSRGFDENSVGKTGEHFAVASVGGL
jgi:hypothetical protein